MAVSARTSRMGLPPSVEELEYRRASTGELVGQAVFSALIVLLFFQLGVILFKVLEPAIRAAPGLLGSGLKVEETLTHTIASVLTLLAPFAAYATCGAKLRGLAAFNRRRALRVALLAGALVYAIATMGQWVFQVGPFTEKPSLEMSFEQTADGVLITEVVKGGTADEAGLKAGDLIIAIGRAPTDLAGLKEKIALSDFESRIGLRIVRDGEEQLVPVTVVPAMEVGLAPLIGGLALALFIAVAAVVWPGGLTPYVLMAAIMIPLLIGYLWLVVASFSYRTEGLLPINAAGEFGGFTMRNWEFLTRQGTSTDPSIWRITLNTLVIASMMMVLVLLVSSMAGYALSRMNFPGRKTFLSLTLILHGFPAVTLLIAIFFVLRNIGKVPVVGDYFGFNTRGGIALVMVAFELPLGVWLMKGFFDNIPWDMERSALIDGASRWRTFWQILLPQIRPGILALGIFAFISGWGAYLIPQTYSIGTKTATLAVYISQRTSETTPVNWNELAAIGLYQMIPVFIIFVFAQEYLLNIYAGGTKGSS